MMRAPKYSPKEAEVMARRFFTYDYHDRGMLKWQGYFLSDHTTALRRQRQQQTEVEQPQLAEQEIGRRLARAWNRQTVVHLQLNVLDPNQTVVGLTGVVAGHNESMVVLKDCHQHYHQLLIDQLRWVGPAKKKNSLG